MPPFPVNPHRSDPYKQFKFRLRVDGRYVPGVASVSGLVRKTQVVVHRAGGGPSTPRRSPGPTICAPLVVTRGRTHDDTFEQWANKVWSLGRGLGSEVSLKDFRKDLALELLNEAGQIAMRFLVYRCWPSEYTALGALDANEASVAVESVTLQHEGWERDRDVKEPEEPSFEGAED